ncbi:MAG TPA: mandelate racemase/muconate lactonizing enzyme family protein [Candidatus Deferrimicrobiaceae bacterium]|nr:mandelate racemase/muconate lactonizing enzyme family protein [Candidatus Deferrimicrobiaceae bacterium]
MRSDPGAAIERVAVYGYELTYAHGDYVMSAGRIVNRLASTVVRITTAAGTEGFGEVCPLGTTYLAAHAEGARAALRELGPAVLGADATNLAEVHRRMDATLRGHEYAKSAIDVACWDAFGRIVGQPVSSLLGGALQRELPLYVAIPLGPPSEMAAFARRERDHGMRRFQLKLGDDPATDAQRVEAVLGATGPGDEITGDANGAWRRQDAIAFANLVANAPRFRLEQPCPTLEECLAVRHLTGLPMVLDEIITDLPALVRAAGLEAMDQVNLKISRVGGLAPARAMRDTAVALGIRLMVEDSWGGDIVSAAVAHLAAGTPPDALFAASFMNDWTNEHVAGYQPRSKDGLGPVPAGPGLGIEVDASVLGEPLLSVST